MLHLLIKTCVMLCYVMKNLSLTRLDLYYSAQFAAYLTINSCYYYYSRVSPGCVSVDSVFILVKPGRSACFPYTLYIL